MSAVITATDIQDLLTTTLYNLGPNKFQQIAQNLQYYEVFSKWFKRDKVNFDSGIGIQRTLMSAFDSSAAAHVTPTDPDSVSIPDLLDTIQIPWRHIQTKWAVVFQTDILMNRGPAMVLKIVKPRRASALLAMVEELENRAWAAAPSTSDKVLPYGVQYWIVENSTTGHNGGLPGSHTTIGGVSLTDSPNFKNYTADYTDVSKTDLVKTMRTAGRKINFKSPLSTEDYRGGIGDRYRVYMNEATLSTFEDVGEAQNENLGRDIATMDGTMIFRGHPMIYVPKLDARTDGPVYMLDHSTFYPVVLEGDYLRESEAQRAPNQHNVYQIFVDLSYNYLCIDRRRNAVFSTDQS